MTGYSFREKADMNLIYRRATGSGRVAARLYNETLPDRKQPTQQAFAAVCCTLTPVSAHWERASRSYTWPEEYILGHVAVDPGVSMIQLAEELALLVMWPFGGYSMNSCCTLTVYRVCRVWRLLSTRQGRIAKPLFVSSVLFNGESTFGRHGITNFHNQNLWAEANPCVKLHARHQQHFRIDVWAGTVYAWLLGISSGWSSRLVKNVPLGVRAWFVQDGTAAHFSLLVQDVLTKICHDK